MFLSFFFLFLLHSLSLRFTQALSTVLSSSISLAHLLPIFLPQLATDPSPKPPSSTHFSIFVCVLAWVSVFVFVFQRGFWVGFLVVFVFQVGFQPLSTHCEYEVLKIFDLGHHVVHSQGSKQTPNYGAEIQLHIFVYSKLVHCLF